MLFRESEKESQYVSQAGSLSCRVSPDSYISAPLLPSMFSTHSTLSLTRLQYLISALMQAMAPQAAHEIRSATNLNTYRKTRQFCSAVLQGPITVLTEFENRIATRLLGLSKYRR
jgi:hypothetical protein